MPRRYERASAGVIALLLVCSVPDRATSQSARIDALSLQSGSRARILGPASDSRYTLITVVSTGPDSLRYSLFQKPDTESLPWQRVRQMDASLGRHQNFLRGAGIGFLAGAVGGALIGAVSATGGWNNTNAGVGAAWWGFFGGFYGIISGAVIGLAWRSESWMPVAIPSRR
jgi:hypothetical protein